MDVDELRIDRDALIQERIMILKLTGSVDAHSFDVLDAAIQEIFAKGSFTLILDMGAVDYVSSAGVGTIVSASDIARKNGGDLVVLSPSDEVMEVLRMLGLLTTLRTAPNMESARGFLCPKQQLPPVRDEWTQWHLTPGGWQRGSRLVHPGKFVERPQPPDRLLSCIYSEYQAADEHSHSRELSEEWRWTDKTAVQEWLDTHGNCPMSL